MTKTDYRQLADNVVTTITGYTFAKSLPISSFESFLSHLNTLLPDDTKTKLIKTIVKDKKVSKNIKSLNDLYSRFKVITNYDENGIEAVEKDTGDMIKAAMLLSQYIIAKGFTKDFEHFENKVNDELKSMQEYKRKLVNIVTDNNK